MYCPFCGYHETQVKDSRPSEEGTAIRRRRVCHKCEQRFTTVERIYLRDLIVIKSDGRKVLFDRDKLVRSLQVALRKRPFDKEKQECLLNDLIRKLEISGEKEIPSRRIGAMAMEVLRQLDEVAYVRFASVYKDFHEVEAFSEILTDMKRS